MLNWYISSCFSCMVIDVISSILSFFAYFFWTHCYFEHNSESCRGRETFGYQVQYFRIPNQGDSSALLILTHCVTLFLLRANGCASISPPLHLPLLAPRLSLVLLSPELFFFFFALSSLPLLTPSTSVSSFLFVLVSFVFSMSLLFTFISPAVSLSLFPCRSGRAEIRGRLRQVVCQSFTRLHEKPDEERHVRVTIHFNLLDMSFDIFWGCHEQDAVGTVFIVRLVKIQKRNCIHKN